LKQTKNKSANVLVTTAGTIVAQGIMKCLNLANSKKPAKISYRILSSDMSPEAVGLYRSRVGYLVPPFSSKDYIDSISKICTDEHITAVFLGADEELSIMSKDSERIKKESGAIVIANPSSVIESCTDKWKTYEFLKKNGFPCPEAALPENARKFLLDTGYPAIVKPREGHGSLHVRIVKNFEDAKDAISTIKKAGWRPMIQEYLPEEGAEFTTGITIDSQGRKIMSSITMRRSLKGGQTYRAFIEDNKYVRRTCEKVGLRLGARGPLNIQGRLSQDKLKIFEINPRFSASCPMRASAGVNEPDIVFRNFIRGEEITPVDYERLVCLRYWNEVYVPYHSYEELKRRGRIEGSHSQLKNYF
jgi:carbamoyl-phosphate synthase large subunit